MSLVRFSHTAEPVTDLKAKIRHTYDLHLMLQDESLRQFFYSPDFDTMLLQVGKDDAASFKNNNSWLQHHPKDALLFADMASVWHELRSTYSGAFRHLCFGDFPNESAIQGALHQIHQRLSRLTWRLAL